MRPGTPGFSGERLREAREARGLSVVSLAELSGVSAQSIYGYEGNKKTPGPTVLAEIAAATRLPQTFFLRPARPDRQDTAFYRSMASATKSARRRADNRLAWVQDIVSYVEQYVDLPAVNLPTFDLPADPLLIADEEVDAVADELRRHWRLGEAPIANMVLLLENQGFVVARGSLGADTLDGLSVHDGRRPFVFIGTDKGSAVRWRFDAAHELGHIALHSHVSQELFQTTAMNQQIEKQAHRFAAAFLLPLAPFGDDLFGVNLDVLRSLKPRWKTSIAMMIVRAKQGGFITDDAERSLWIAMSRRKWRKSEPLDDILEPEEPRLLRRSIEMILDAGDQTPADICDYLALTPSDIEDLTGLRSGYLSSHSRVELSNTSNVISLFGSSGETLGLFDE